MLAIIGGTGLTKLTNLEIYHRQAIRTPYGDPSGPLTFGKLNNHDVIFLARHGYGHTIAPHEVNYRANLWALSNQGVTRIVSVASVGGIAVELAPGTIAVPDQIIDYTYGRKATFFEGRDKPVTHMDFTRPYCEKMRKLVLSAAHLAGEDCLPGGVYAATQGPRLETAAEVNRLERDGATMIGMTGMPECALAKELGICYAALTVVANQAAGRGLSEDGISYQEVESGLIDSMRRVRAILEQVVRLDGSDG